MIKHKNKDRFSLQGTLNARKRSKQISYNRSVLRIRCGSESGSWIRTGKKLIQILIWIQVISLIFTDFFNKKNFKVVLFFSLIFILNFYEPFVNGEICIISLFAKVRIWVFRSKKVLFLQFLVYIYSLGSGSVDPHIFADPDPGSQNFADPTDPDPNPKSQSQSSIPYEFSS